MSIGNERSKDGSIKVPTTMDELTGNEKEILDMVIGLDLTDSEIAKRRGISERMVRKYKRNIKQKGWWEPIKNKGSKKPMPTIIKEPNPQTNISNGERFYRLHNLHFIIDPYYFYPKYERSVKSFGIYFGKWTLTLNAKNIELQLKSEESFDSKDIDDCRRQAQESLNHALHLAGEKYGFEVFKEQRCSVRLVNQHLAEVYNGIAKKLDGELIKIEDKDGKVWLVIDKSLKRPEQETVDPILATDDGKLLGKYYNDWRENNPPTNSELLRYLTETAKGNLENTRLMHHYGEHWKTHVKVLNEISEFLKDERERRKSEAMRFLSQPSRPQHSSQLSLLQYTGGYE